MAVRRWGAVLVTFAAFVAPATALAGPEPAPGHSLRVAASPLEAVRATAADGSTSLVSDGSPYVPLVPARVLDTRSGYATVDGAMAGVGAVGGQASLDLPVLGRGGVPAVGVAAVAVNVTAVSPTAPGFVTVYPTGERVPNASNLNFTPGQVVPNFAIAKVGAGGQISLFNYAGNTDLVVDVVGWYPIGAPGATASRTILTVPASTGLASGVDVVGVLPASPSDAASTVNVTLGPSAPTPPVGGTLVVQPTADNPDGFIGLVTARNLNPDGTTTLATTHALLSDAFPAGEINYSGPLQPLLTGSSSTASTTKRTEDLNPHLIPLGHVLGLKCYGSLVNVDLTASIDASIDAHLSWGPSRSTEVKIVVNLGANLEANLSGGLKADCEAETPPGITWIVDAGPVVLTVHPKAFFSMTGQVNAITWDALNLDPPMGWL